MHALLMFIFLIVAACSNGDHQVDMAIVSALFGIASSICYHSDNKNDK